MKIQGACKLLLLGVICTAFFLASVITASAQDCEFSLTDAQPNVGRLFRFSLECRSTNKIAAFVSEIEYDAQALKYRSVRKEAENAEYSINVIEEGKGFIEKLAGAETVTIQNLEVVRVDLDKNVILVKGSVPGAKGAILKIKNSVKAVK